MDIVTLDTMIKNARLYADMVNSDFMSYDEWTVFINDAMRQYYDLVEQLTQDYYFKEYFFSTLPNQLQYPLPPDFYHLRGVDAAYTIVAGQTLDSAGTLWVALSSFMFDERNARTYLYYQTVVPPYFSRYRLQGDFIKFEPLTAIGGTLIRISYTPKCPILVTGTDTFDVISGFDKYISKVAAVWAKQREESDVSILLNDLERFKSEIKQLAGDRNRDQAQRCQDVYAKQFNVWGY